MKKLILSALLLAAYAIGVQAQAVGTIAPDFAIKNEKDSAVMLSSYRTHEENGIHRPGCYVLLDFWATWCPSCSKEIPTLKKIDEKYLFKLKMIGISLDTDKKVLEDFTQKNGMFWQMYCEYKKWMDTDIFKAYPIQLIPRMLLIDPDGKVAYSTDSAKDMLKKLESLDRSGKLTPYVTPAEFPGGVSHLYQLMGQQIKFPPLARKYNAQARVKVSFVVDESGHLTDTKIESYESQPLTGKDFNALSPGEQKEVEAQVKTLFSQEALRLMTWIDANYTWTPCIDRGMKQRMKYNVALAFKPY